MSHTSLPNTFIDVPYWFLIISLGVWIAVFSRILRNSPLSILFGIAFGFANAQQIIMLKNLNWLYVIIPGGIVIIIGLLYLIDYGVQDVPVNGLCLLFFLLLTLLMTFLKSSLPNTISNYLKKFLLMTKIASIFLWNVILIAATVGFTILFITILIRGIRNN